MHRISSPNQRSDRRGRQSAQKHSKEDSRLSESSLRQENREEWRVSDDGKKQKVPAFYLPGCLLTPRSFDTALHRLPYCLLLGKSFEKHNIARSRHILIALLLGCVRHAWRFSYLDSHAGVDGVGRIQTRICCSVAKKRLALRRSVVAWR